MNPLSIHLPDINGLEVCRRLKADTETRHIPVLHLTATYLNLKDKVAGLEGGADGYLTYPVEPYELIATIHSLLRIKKTEDALRESEERFHRLSEATVEGIAIHDKGKIIEANSAIARLFGYELAELIGMDILDLAAPESRNKVVNNSRSGFEGHCEAIGLRKDGTTFIGEFVEKSIPFKGRIVRVTAIRDISEQRRNLRA